MNYRKTISRVKKSVILLETPVVYEITSDIKWSKYPNLRNFESIRAGGNKGSHIFNKKEEWLTKMIDGWRKNFEHIKMITRQNVEGFFI